MRRLTLMISLLTSLAFGIACGDDDGMPTLDAATSDATMADSGPDATMADSGPDMAMEEDGGVTTRSLALSFDGLPDLGEDFVYEGWLIVDGSPVTTGRFSVDDGGALDPATFNIAAEDADMASLFVLTIEPVMGDEPAPSSTHVLAGAIEGGTAALSIGHMAALGNDFSDAAGSFILATPSTTDAADNNQGIWWLVPGDTPAASLTLPTLPAGWAYEGWVVDTSGAAPAPVSTGRFLEAAGEDSDMAGAAAGPDGSGPPFPGQDFIDPSVDLTADHMAVISIEPEPDNHPGPFQLKPLVTMPIGSDVAPAAQDMMNTIAGNNISGTATIQ